MIDEARDMAADRPALRSGGRRVPPALRRAGIAAAAALATLFAAMLALFALADHGYLDPLVERWASHALGRRITFTRLRTNLLSSTPWIRVRGLTIGNPAWMKSGDLARIRLIQIRFGFWPLLSGRFVMSEVSVDGADLHLVRFAPGKNNWKMSSGGSGPAFAPLLSVIRFRAIHSRLDFRDYGRDLLFRGTFGHDDAAPAPFTLDGGGFLRGGPIHVHAVGGRLNGDAVNRPYPFEAWLDDRATHVHVRGTSGEPFNLTTYALKVAANGPNLADIGYIFNLITPNTAPFTGRADTFSDGTHIRFEHLDLRTGASRITGRIWSDHSHARREIRADFMAPVLDRQDINAMLSAVPPRTVTSWKSGAAPPGPPSPWIISDAPFSARRLNGADFDFKVGVARLTGYALPLTDIATRIDLDHGLLDFPTFRARLYGGTITGQGQLDSRTATPIVKTRIAMAGANLASLTHSPMAGARATVDGRLQLTGVGNSLHKAASVATGSVAMQLHGAILPKRAGWMLGGDLLRAALAGSKSGDVPIDCGAASFAGRGGRFQAIRAAMVTPLGTATGTGFLDFGSESVSMTLLGHADHRRLFQVAAPVTLNGPWLTPKVGVLPGAKAHKLGLHGIAGVVLTPLAGLLPLGKTPAPPATCAGIF